MTKRLNRDDVDRFHDYGLYMPMRTVYMGSEFITDDGESGVDAAMAEKFLKNLTVLESMSEDPITVVMNNPGGCWYNGMAIYDAIKCSTSDITLKVFGSAMSMGGVILQAAKERILSPNSKFMMHYGYDGSPSNHTKIVQKWNEESKKINKHMEDIFLEKIRQKHPDFKLKKLQDMLNFDTILSAQEAVDLGLADRILGEDE